MGCHLHGDQRYARNTHVGLSAAPVEMTFSLFLVLTGRSRHGWVRLWSAEQIDGLRERWLVGTERCPAGTVACGSGSVACGDGLWAWGNGSAGGDVLRVV